MLLISYCYVLNFLYEVAFGVFSILSKRIEEISYSIRIEVVLTTSATVVAFYEIRKPK